MKRFVIICALLFSLSNLYSQRDSAANRKVSFGLQGSGQFVSEFEQTWIPFNNYRFLYYCAGVYLKWRRHFIYIVGQSSVRGKPYLVPSIGYNYKINNIRSKYDFALSGKLFVNQGKYKINDEHVTCIVYTDYALAFGASLTKAYGRLSWNAGLYNYCTFSGYNRRFKTGLPKLQMLYGEEFSGDFILEFKLQYRLSK